MTQNEIYKTGKNILLIGFIYGFPAFAMVLVFLSILEGQLLKSICIYLLASLIMGGGLVLLIHKEKSKEDKRVHNIQPIMRDKNQKLIQYEKVLQESAVY